MLDEAQQAHDARVQLARIDPNWWMEVAWKDKRGTPLRQGAIHREFQDYASQHQHLMYETHRFGGKTTQSVGRATWELGHDRDLGITIVCANDKKARKRLGEIRGNIQRNPDVRVVFPDLEIESVNKSQLLLRRAGIARDFSVEAYGVLSSGTGDRTDVLIFDDICDRRNSLTYPGLRRAVKDAYPDWLNLLGPDGRSIYLFTQWSNEDLSQDLKKQGKIPLLRRLVDAEWTSAGELRRLAPVWPEMWGHEALLERLDKIQPRAFKRDFCGLAVDDSERAVWPNWFKSAPPPFPLESAVRIQIWDGASPRKAVSPDPDYMAFIDMYVSPLHGLVYVDDAWRARGLSPSQQVRAVTSRTEEGPPPDYVIIEQVGESALCALVEECGHDFRGETLFGKGRGFLNGARLEAIGTEGKRKEVRAAEYCAPLMETGKLLFSPRLDPDENPDALPVRDELVDLPFGTHDDLADCVVYGCRAARAVARIGPKDEPGVAEVRGEANLY